MPAGRKQFPGHAEILAFMKISVMDMLDVLGARGSPVVLLKDRAETLYPTGGSRSHEPWKET